MTNSTLLGTWIRRFLLEHLVAERNLSLNTQKSYRDMLMKLLPYLAEKSEKSIDRLIIDDLSAQRVRLFLSHLEESGCSTSTRNQRLAGIHALTRFIGEHNPEYVEWCSQIRLIPFKRTCNPEIASLDKQEMDALLAAYDKQSAQGEREHALLLFLYNSGALHEGVFLERCFDGAHWLRDMIFFWQYQHSHRSSIYCHGRNQSK